MLSVVRSLPLCSLAIAIGVPSEVGGGGRAVVEPIGRDAHDRTRMAVSRESGRAALSVVHTLATDGRLSLCAVRIGTGRTHQIRVHLRQYARGRAPTPPRSG